MQRSAEEWGVYIKGDFLEGLCFTFLPLDGLNKKSQEREHWKQGGLYSLQDYECCSQKEKEEEKSVPLIRILISGNKHCQQYN